MSTSASARPSRKYTSKSSILLERRDYGHAQPPQCPVPNVRDCFGSVAKLTWHAWQTTARAPLPLWYPKRWTYPAKMTPIHFSKTSSSWWISIPLESMRCKIMCARSLACNRRTLKKSLVSSTCLQNNSNTTIDRMLIMHNDVGIMPYVSYFSYHRQCKRKMSSNRS